MEYTKIFENENSLIPQSVRIDFYTNLVTEDRPEIFTKEMVRMIT